MPHGLKWITAEEFRKVFVPNTVHTIMPSHAQIEVISENFADVLAGYERRAREKRLRHAQDQLAADFVSLWILCIMIWTLPVR